MEAAIHDLAILLGPLTTQSQVKERTTDAAKLLFPSCKAAGLLISQRNQRTVNCPLNILLRGILTSLNEEIITKEIHTEFSQQIIANLNGRFTLQQEEPFANSKHQLVYALMNPMSKPSKYQTYLVMICDSLPMNAIQRTRILMEQLSVALDRAHHLEQLTFGSKEVTFAACVANTADCNCCAQPPAGNSYSGSHIKSRREAHSLLKLCSELYDQDTAILQRKVMHFLLKKTESETGFLLLHVMDTFDFVCHCVGNVIYETPIYMKSSGNMFAQVLETQKVLRFEELTKNQIQVILNILRPAMTRSSESVSSATSQVNVIPGFRLTSLICIPIIGRSSNETIAIVCLINKLTDSQFSLEDEKIVEECFRYTTSVLISSVAYHNERMLKARTEKLLSVAKNIFSHIMDLPHLFLRIMLEAQNLTNAERCSVFLVDRETEQLVAKVLDGLPTSHRRGSKFKTFNGEIVEQPQEIRISLTQGVAGYVALTGKMLNIRDAYNHPLFYPGVDEVTGFRTRNILCFPIKNDKDGIVGVAELCNKIDYPHFTNADEEVAKTFSVYCCISIVHSLMYQRLQDAQHRTRLANELMMYHMNVTDERVVQFTKCKILPMSSLLKDATSFSSTPREIKDEDDSIMVILSMFEELELINRWHISRHTLSRFVLMVRRGYRDPPYHNWSHAFSVCHFVYLCQKNLGIETKHLTELEFFALFVASLCHDIDHRGTNNTFQMQSKSVLAALYSSQGSVLERHHFSQTICILHSEDANILSKLAPEEYCVALDLIRDVILASDLSHHINNLPKLEKMAENGYDNTNLEHHSLLLGVFMTAADLNDQTKCWENTKAVAKLIYDEFFNQGDMEKKLGHLPSEQMDRERASIPRLQTSFLDHIVLPLFQILRQLYKKIDMLYYTIILNRRKWEALCARVELGELQDENDAIFNNDFVFTEEELKSEYS